MPDNETDIANEGNMSKKELKALKKQEKQQLKRQKKDGKGGGFIKLVLIIIIILGAIFALLYFDVFGIRSKYVDDKIEGTPLEQVFQNATNAPSGNNEGEDIRPRGELLAEISSLEAQIVSLESELESEKEKNELYVSQINQMSPLVEEQVAFKEEKEEFDKKIAANDPDAYSAFYESIYPETAKQIYNSIVAQENADSVTSDYIATFSSMDEGAAAEILETMYVTDLDLVVSILNNMSPDQSGAILAEMEPDSAATVAKRMAPVLP